MGSKQGWTWWACMAAWTLAGCGDDGKGTRDCARMICPSDGGGTDDGSAPADAADVSGDAGATDGTAPDSGSGGTRDSGTPVDASVDAAICDALWEHPIVDGDRRYCEQGDCYCADPDGCWTSEMAAACCGGEVTCASPDGGTADAGPTCDELWEHPLVDGDRRYCEDGDCYCADPDGCWPMDAATRCCNVDPDCGG